MHSKYVIFYSNGLDINLPEFFCRYSKEELHINWLAFSIMHIGFKYQKSSDINFKTEHFLVKIAPCILNVIFYSNSLDINLPGLDIAGEQFPILIEIFTPVISFFFLICVGDTLHCMY